MTIPPSPANDLKALWQGQPQEIAPASLEEIRRRAERFQHRKRLANGIEYLSVAVVSLIYAYSLTVLPGIYLKLGCGYAVVWGLFYAWQRRRLMSARPVPDGATASLDFHRRELERQRDALRGAWRWMLAPLPPFFVLIVLGRWIDLPALNRTPWLDHLVILVSIGVFIETLVLAWLWLENRGDRLQDELDDIDRLGRAEP
jgi:hypothetical protein